VPLGMAIGVFGAFIGTVIGFWKNVTLSGTVAMTMGAFFAIALVASPRHGLITQVARRMRQRREFFDTLLTIHLMHHEGTAAEDEESRLGGLHRHLGWTEHFTRVVLDRVVGRGWADVRGDRLALRPTGREVARAAAGGPSPGPGESVS